MSSGLAENVAAVSEGEAEADAPWDADGLGDGDGEPDGLLDEGEGEAAREGERGATGAPVAVVDAGPGVVTSGTPCLTSSAAWSRDGAWYENTPLANPAAATTATPAPATTAGTVRRDRRRPFSPRPPEATGPAAPPAAELRALSAPSSAAPPPAGPREPTVHASPGCAVAEVRAVDVRGSVVSAGLGPWIPVGGAAPSAPPGPPAVDARAPPAPAPPGPSAPDPRGAVGPTSPGCAVVEVRASAVPGPPVPGSRGVLGWAPVGGGAVVPASGTGRGSASGGGPGRVPVPGAGDACDGDGSECCAATGEDGSPHVRVPGRRPGSSVLPGAPDDPASAPGVARPPAGRGLSTSM
ncbi:MULTISPECIES: hypothetical protein [unclassified Streptomyces]|uniref:hypothetical protein n=1 Tax=unclassified Streptomyces TaxID=2593676 RepID=UPI00210E43C6|nr:MULTISPECIES: hypothetical protein [unclassified Streptomyces]